MSGALYDITDRNSTSELKTEESNNFHLLPFFSYLVLWVFGIPSCPFHPLELIFPIFVLSQAAFFTEINFLEPLNS